MVRVFQGISFMYGSHVFNANMMVVRKSAQTKRTDTPNDDMFNNNLMKKVLIQNIDVDLYYSAIAQTI